MYAGMWAITLLSSLTLVDSTLVTTREQQEEMEWALDQLPHHRAKRFLFLTEEKRLVMPPGSQLVLTPTLALPFMRSVHLVLQNQITGWPDVLWGLMWSGA